MGYVALFARVAAAAPRDRKARGKIFPGEAAGNKASASLLAEFTVAAARETCYAVEREKEENVLDRTACAAPRGSFLPFFIPETRSVSSTPTFSECFAGDDFALRGDPFCPRRQKGETAAQGAYPLGNPLWR